MSYFKRKLLLNLTFFGICCLQMPDSADAGWGCCCCGSDPRAGIDQNDGGRQTPRRPSERGGTRNQIVPYTGNPQGEAEGEVGPSRAPQGSEDDALGEGGHPIAVTVTTTEAVESGSSNDERKEPITELVRDGKSVASLGRVDFEQEGLLESICFFNRLPSKIRTPLKATFMNLEVKDQEVVIRSSNFLLGKYFFDKKYKTEFPERKLLIIQRIISLDVAHHDKLIELHNAVIQQGDPLLDTDKLQLASALVQLSPEDYENVLSSLENCEPDGEFVQKMISEIKLYVHRFEDGIPKKKKKKRVVRRSSRLLDRAG